MKKIFVILFFIITTCPIAIYAQKDSTKTLSPEVRFQDSFAQANIHLLKGDNAKAVACLVNCLKINPSSSATNFQLARVYYLDRNYDVALNYALKAHHLKPDNRWYSRFTALVYEQLNDYDKAKKFFQYFLNSDPTYDDYESFYSFQLDFGKIDDAIATLDKMETLFGYQTLYSLHRFLSSIPQASSRFGLLRTSL